VIQTQVFSTIGLAMHFAGERVRGFQWAALLLAAAGIVVIAVHTDGSTTVGGVAMVMFGAFCWGCGNLAAKRAGSVNMLAYVVWTSAFAIPPLLVLSLAVEGWDAMHSGLIDADATTWAAVLWQAWGNTLFGMGTAAAMLGEPLPAWKLAAALLVMTGLALNMLWPRWAGRAAA